MSLEIFLETLADPSASVLAGDFFEASDLLPRELGLFARTWFSIPAERQRWIIATMVDLAEDNPELDFCAVFKMCLKERDEEVLEKAMEGLWEHEDRSVIPRLVEILNSNKSPRARSASAVALGKFAVIVQEGKLLPKDGELIHDSLMAVLADQDQHVDVRRRSLEAIAPFNTGDIRRYVSWAYESQDLDLRSSSIFAMGRTGEPSWLPLLIKELQSPEPAFRYESAHACGELGEEDAVPHLVSLLEDDEYTVQLAGLNALGKIGGPLAKKVLLHCVKEGDATLEEAARAGLQNIEYLEDPMSFSSET
jgi:HEAT repeat protein